MTDHIRRWDSFAEFVLEASRPITSGNVPCDHGDEHSGCSLQDSFRVARDGWPEGLARMQAIRAQIKPLAGEMAERMMSNYADSGDEVCVSRFLDGEPEHMVEFQPQFVPAAGRVIRLIVNLHTSGGLSRELMFMRGAAACMLADAIEQAGLRTEIIMCSACTTGSRYSCYYIPLKRPDEPLELDRMAFALAHAATFRRLVFQVNALEEGNIFYEYYGGAAHGYGAEVKDITADDIYLGRLLLGEISTVEQTAAFVNRTLARYTEPVPA